MKILRGVMLVIFVGFATFIAVAGELPAGDPHIKTGGGGGGLSDTTFGPAGIVTTSFTIESPTGTSPGTSPCFLIEGGLTIESPKCFFENDITTDGVGDTITELTFDALGIPASTVTCGFLAGSPFTSCSVEAITGGTAVNFTGGSIPFHTDFTLDFSGFPQNFNFGSTATVTPEPATVALLLTGLCPLLLRRRRHSEV